MTRSILKYGDVILTKFPYTDLSGTALRPALIISPGTIGQDLILLAISSVIRGSLINSDYIFEVTHPEFPKTGLKVKSVIRTHKIITVEESIIVRKLGVIGPQVNIEVNKRLKVLLNL